MWILLKKEDVIKLDLKKYLDDRDKKRDITQTPGPVITISREHGCDAMSLAKKVVERISEEPSSKRVHWKCINKEVLEQAANELKVSTKKITSAMDTRQELIVQDIFSSFTQHYGVTNKNVLDTIKDVLKSYSDDGHALIVGRGGALIARDIENSLHIKLQASIDWRINQIRTKYDLELDEAKSQISEMDEKRNIWNKQLTKGGTSNSVYDLIFNRETISEEDILDMIFVNLFSRKMV